MFPPNLQKNIRELDRQISLLETECENMDSEKNENCTQNEKSSFRGDCQKSSEPIRSASSYSSKRGNSPGTVSKINSAGSVPVKALYKKVYKGNEMQGSPDDESEDAVRSDDADDDCRIHARRQCVNPVRRSQGIPTTNGCEDGKVVECVENYRKDGSISRREQQFVRPEEAASTVVDRSNDEDVGKLSGKRFVREATESSDENLNDRCCRKPDRVRSREPTWSDVLCQQLLAARWKEETKKMDGVPSEEIPIKSKMKFRRSYSKTNPSSDDEGCKSLGREDGTTNEKEFNLSVSPVDSLFCKKRRARSVRTKTKCINEIPIEINKGLQEKQVQCMLWNEEKEKTEFLTNLNDSINTLHLLVSELKKKSTQEKRNDVLNDMQTTLMKISGIKSMSPLQNCLSVLPACPRGDKLKLLEGEENNIVDIKKTFIGVKQICKQLYDEKSILSEEITARNRVILSLKNKEQEYLMLISNLKINLEKTREEAEEGGRAKKELVAVKNKLQEEVKVIEALKKNHGKMQDLIQNYVLENDQLRTQVRLAQLESQKFNVLLAGKDIEIKKYKEEMDMFQRQITEQLNLLRSKASDNEVENAMVVLSKQTRILRKTEAESLTSETTFDKNYLTNNCSPISTKTSLESLWTQTRSIAESEENKGGFDSGGIFRRKDGPIDSGRDFQFPPLKTDSVPKEVFRSCQSRSESVESCDKKDDTFPCTLKGVLVNTKKIRNNIDEILLDMKKCSGSRIGNAENGQNDLSSRNDQLTSMSSGEESSEGGRNA